MIAFAHKKEKTMMTHLTKDPWTVAVGEAAGSLLCSLEELQGNWLSAKQQQKNYEQLVAEAAADLTT